MCKNSREGGMGMALIQKGPVAALVKAPVEAQCRPGVVRSPRKAQCKGVISNPPRETIPETVRQASPQKPPMVSASIHFPDCSYPQRVTVRQGIAQSLSPGTDGSSSIHCKRAGEGLTLEELFQTGAHTDGGNE